MNTYYVYAYLRAQDSATAKAGTPYYIGKGKGNRAYNKHRAPIPKDKQNIVFLETDLTDIGACAIERRLIRWWGRKDLNTGILLNMTDGGDGVSGRKNSEISNVRRSITQKGKSKPSVSIARKGQPSPNRGKIASIETLQKRSDSMKGKNAGPQNRVQCPHCNKDGGISLMKRYHLDNCKLNVKSFD